MKLKKIFTWGATSVLLAALAVMPVSAKAPADAICEECAVSGCTQTGYHLHDKKIYCGYTHAKGYCDGSCDSTTGTCGVAGCTQTGHHDHNAQPAQTYSYEAEHHDYEEYHEEHYSEPEHHESEPEHHESSSSSSSSGGHHGRHHGGHH